MSIGEKMRAGMRILPDSFGKRKKIIPEEGETEVENTMMKSTDEILAAMTPEEKAAYTVGFSRAGQEIWPKGAAGCTMPLPRLGVPSAVMADGPAGVRLDPEAGKKFAICYPSESNLACSFDIGLAEEVGRCIGEDARDYGVDILLAPALNLQRDPLGGRNFEYFSEDPYLTAAMGIAYVRGVQSAGTGACIKHLACNNRETERGKYSSEVDERTLREVYLSAFRAVAQEARPWCIMTAYNKLNGVYTNANRFLTGEIVYGEWNYDGMIMSDWGADGDNIERVRAQNDLYMEGSAEKCEEVVAAVRDGILSEEETEKCCRRILDVVRRTHAAKGNVPSGKLDSRHAEVALRAAEDSIVLLKNEGMLPFSGDTLSLFGNTQKDPVVGGLGAGDVNTAPYPTFRDTFSARFALGRTAEKLYSDCPPRRRGASEDENPEDGGTECVVLPETAARAAQESDCAVVFIGRLTREGKDHSARKGDYRLNDREREMISAVSRAFHARGKKVCVVINAGNPVETESWSSEADALLFIGYAGQRCAEALCKVFSGEVNPSARLACTFPVACEDSPAFLPPEADPLHIFYGEGIFTGYRHYEKTGTPCAYPFGYGLSYTCFRGGEPEFVREEDDAFLFSRTVENIGARAGKYASLLYVSKPVRPGLAQAGRQLAAFSKTFLLPPGGSQTLFFRIEKRWLHTWVAEIGDVLLKGDYVFSFEDGKNFSLNLPKGY